MTFGLLLLRLVIGALFIGHGTQKVFGWFGGGGPKGTAGFFDSLDYERPRKTALAAGWTETVAGVLLVLGLLTPLAAAAILGVMVNAILTVHRPNGIWNSQGGMEYPLVLAAAATMFGFTGPGAPALDNLIGIMGGWGWGVVTLLLGLASGFAVAYLMRDTSTAEADEHLEQEEEYEERQAA